MQLEEQLTSIRNREVHPANEAETCHWVILPLLHAAGYDHHEIRIQQTDGSGKFPDFTILPNTDNTWYLEAKTWSEKLTDGMADQPLYSAYSNGKRWVVLSNGRSWRLYDGQINGTSSDRLVIEVDLKSDDLLALLNSLSKESVTGGQLSEFAAAAKLRVTLLGQLKDPSSKVVSAIVNALKNSGVPKADGKSVIACLESLSKAASTQKHDSPPPTVQHATQSQPTQSVTPRPTGDINYYLLPVSKDSLGSARECLERLFPLGNYALPETATFRSHLKPGDRLCFYEAGKGVIAEAEVASKAERKSAPGVSEPAKFPWSFKIANARFLSDTIPVDLEMRKQLEIFNGKNPDGNWSWFVQSVSKISKADFEKLTRRTG